MSGEPLRGSVFCRCGAEVELHACPGPKDDPRLFLRSEALFYLRQRDCPECRTPERWEAIRSERDRWEPRPNIMPPQTIGVG